MGVGALLMAGAVASFDGPGQLRSPKPLAEPPSTGAGLMPWMWLAAGAGMPLWAALARRLPFDRRHVLVSLPVHAALALALAFLTATLYHSAVGGEWIDLPAWLGPQALLPQLVVWSTPLAFAIVAFHGLAAFERGRQRRVEAAHLRAQLSEARLRSLTARLEPHFLFNTLQGISTLLHRDPGAADEMLGQLGELLRESLVGRDQPCHTLGRELELLEHYLAICRRRFGDRLDDQRDVADEVHSAQVPFFMLQPLVENAVEHGLGGTSGPVTITVFAHRSDDDLVFGVIDDGPGPPAQAGEGVALSNTRERVQQLYGERGRFRLEPLRPHGARAEVRIPYLT